MVPIHTSHSIINITTYRIVFKGPECSQISQISKCRKRESQKSVVWLIIVMSFIYFSDILIFVKFALVLIVLSFVNISSYIYATYIQTCILSNKMEILIYF